MILPYPIIPSAFVSILGASSISNTSFSWRTSGQKNNNRLRLDVHLPQKKLKHISFTSKYLKYLKISKNHVRIVSSLPFAVDPKKSVPNSPKKRCWPIFAALGVTSKSLRVELPPKSSSMTPFDDWFKEEIDQNPMGSHGSSVNQTNFQSKGFLVLLFASTKSGHIGSHIQEKRCKRILMNKGCVWIYIYIYLIYIIYIYIYLG